MATEPESEAESEPGDHSLESHLRIATRVDRPDAGDRYVLDETYDGDAVVFDRTNPNAWIRSDVTWSVVEGSSDDR